MQKEDLGDLINSQQGRVNLALSVSAFIVFLLTFLISEVSFVQAQNWGSNFSLLTPSNSSFNGTSINLSSTFANSRNINFTFRATWQSDLQNASNCSLNINSTDAAIGWTIAKNVSMLKNGTATQPDDMINNYTGTAGTLSYMNFTFSADGNYTFAIGCYNNNASGLPNSTGNYSFFLDTAAPTIVLVTPGGVMRDNTQHNITSNITTSFFVNISDNSTKNVFMILSRYPAFYPGTSITWFGQENQTVNKTMTFDRATTTSGRDRDFRMYNFSLGANTLLNFSSNFTGPGPHSVFFCANDSLGRITCSNQTDYVLKGITASDLESQFSSGTDGGITGPNGFIFSGLDVRYGNGTEFPPGDFMNPTTANFTFIINLTAGQAISIVGARIDDQSLANASQTNYSNEISSTARSQAGTGFNSNMTWVDVKSFIPSEVQYEYGIIHMKGIFGKVMYCNGTSNTVPNCFPISVCNATAIGLFNHSSIIPVNSACWLTSGFGMGGPTTSNYSLESGFTYIFVDHFSGGLGANDFGPPNVTFFSPLTSDSLNVSINRSTTVTQLINFTVDDTASTGLNLSANNSINVTITLGGTIVAFFNYTNSTNPRLQCNSSDINFPQNTTSITCNVTYAFNSNGTYLINVTGRDTSNVSNAMNTTTNWFRLTIDQIPPRFDYYNITNVQLNNTGSGLATNALELGTTPATTNNISTTAQGNSIFVATNWTDNLTQPNRAMFQFWNETATTWVTLNYSSTTSFALNATAWLNFSYPILRGHNEFEGKNVSFRVVANDTVGNVNTSLTVKNFTIQINDTTAPNITIVTIGDETATNGNLTNTTVSTPKMIWNITENSQLLYVAVQFDSLTDIGCNQFINYTGNANAKRNGTFTLSDAGGCLALGNGTHVARVKAGDTWGNGVEYLHNFTIQSGATPTISLSTFTLGSTAANRTTFSNINGTYVKSNTGINFTAIVGAGGQLKNLSYTSSCNSTIGTFTNGTPIKPFGGCDAGTSATKTVTVTATDFSGNSVTNLFQFYVDDVAPSIAVWSPTEGGRFTNTNNVSLNWSAKDDAINLSFTGYYLDGTDAVTLLNFSALGQADNSSNRSESKADNFTAGTHTIKFTANDSLGNQVNGSVITFTVEGSLPLLSLGFNSSANGTLIAYNGNISRMNLTNASDDSIVDDFRSVDASILTDQTLKLKLSLNATPGKLVNVSLVFNASAANWNRYNFSVRQNNTAIMEGIRNNQSVQIREIITFNNSIDEFLPDSGYYGIVTFPFNASTFDLGSAVKIRWYANSSKLKDPTNVTQCLSTFTTSGAKITAGTVPCWNASYNSNQTHIFVSHFSHITVEDDIAPNYTINIPTPEQPLSVFIPNITVSDDTKNCTYAYQNSTEILMTLVEDAVISTCVGSEIKNLTNGSAETNISFNVYDTSNNQRRGSLLFTLNDTTVHNMSSIAISSISATGAVVTVTANESVNVTINTTGATSFTNVVSSSYNKSIALTLSSLSASTKYNFTVITCDRAGNCNTSISDGFTTSAAAAAAAAAATTSSSGASGGGAAPVSNVVASAARQWDTLAAGSTGSLTINNANIAVTAVSIDIKNTVTSPSITVESLSNNPYTTTAGGKVHQYLEIRRSNIADSDASKITIDFKVPKSWLSTNGVGEDSVVLYRYSGGAWSALSTSKTGADTNNVIYQSTTPGFSTFAIGTKEGAPAAPVTEEIPAALVTEEIPAAPVTEAVPAAPVAPPEAKKGLSSTTMALIAVLLIVVIGALGYFMWQKKKGE